MEAAARRIQKIGRLVMNVEREYDRTGGEGQGRECRGRRKEKEGRRKEEGGRRKKEEGRRWKAARQCI
jgi:hypothetical protein